MGMLVLSLFGFLLPIYLHSFANGIQEKFEQINSSNREAEKLNTLIEQNANDESRAYIEWRYHEKSKSFRCDFPQKLIVLRILRLDLILNMTRIWQVWNIL